MTLILLLGVLIDLRPRKMKTDCSRLVLDRQTDIVTP